MHCWRRWLIKLITKHSRSRRHPCLSGQDRAQQPYGSRYLRTRAYLPVLQTMAWVLQDITVWKRLLRTVLQRETTEAGCSGNLKLTAIFDSLPIVLELSQFFLGIAFSANIWTQQHTIAYVIIGQQHLFLYVHYRRLTDLVLTDHSRHRCPPFPQVSAGALPIFPGRPPGSAS